MYKTIIDGRPEKSIIFLRCYCGGEIISVYYYPATTTCREIIALDYYGDLSKKLSKYKHFDFDRDSFLNFINAVDRCTLEGPYKKEFKSIHSTLKISKESTPFSEISIQYDKWKKPIKVWDMTIRNSEIKEFSESLKEMWEVILKC